MAAAAGDSGMEGRKLHANISSFESESMSRDVHDLLVEILLRLPSKSLMRFKCVCKSWRALIISKYFCLLWQQNHHQGPGILLMSRITEARYLPLSGPAVGKPRFEIPRDFFDYMLQSCNGFLLLAKYDVDAHIHNFWVYNPATMEVVFLRPPRMYNCKIHARRRCNCVMQSPVLAFDSHSNGRVIAIAKHLSKRKDRYLYQVCVTENLGAWRSSSKPFRLQPLSCGVHWHNFVVWLNPEKTLLYDVRKEVLRFCDPPDCSNRHYFYEFYRPDRYHLGTSGGHLHFIHNQGNRIIIKEMKHDLSGWFLKHNIESSQIEASLFGSIGWDVNTDIKFEINFLIEEKEDSMLVLDCRKDVVLYRIQDDKSWKLCEWEEFMEREQYAMFSFVKYFRKDVHQHVETISRFHDKY